MMMMMRLLIVVALATSCTAGWFTPCVPQSCEEKFGPEMTSTNYGDGKTCEPDQSCHAKMCQSLVNASTPYIVYAHMTNNVASVKWAIEQGANAVEMDVNFEGTEAQGFKHGWPCDCTCIGPYIEGLKSENLTNGEAVEKKTICQFQDPGNQTNDICLGLTSLEDMFQHVSTTQLSIVYLDCKLGDVAGYFDDTGIKNDKYTEAGSLLADHVHNGLFAAGFKGNIVVNGIDVEYIEFLKAFRANFEKNYTTYKNRIAYVFDMANNPEASLRALADANFEHITYGNGISSCVNSLAGYGPTMSKDMRLAGQNTESFAVGATLWTIDNYEVMKTYVLDYGVRGLMTNAPAVALEVINQVGGTLDQFQDRDFPDATVPVNEMQLTLQPCGPKCLPLQCTNATHAAKAGSPSCAAAECVQNEPACCTEARVAGQVTGIFGAVGDLINCLDSQNTASSCGLNRRKLNETVTFEYPAGKGRALADTVCFDEGDSVLDLPIYKASVVSNACAEKATKGACTGTACTWNTKAAACTGSVEPYADLLGISAKFMTWMAGNEACASKDTCNGNECMVDDDGECVASDSIITVAVSDVMAKQTECGALTKDACNTKACSPSADACNLSLMHGMGLIFTEEKPMYKLIETALGCSAHTKEGDCSGNCAWDSAKGGFYGGSLFLGACDISDEAAMDAFLPPKCVKPAKECPLKCDTDSGNCLRPAATWIVAAVLLATIAGM